MGDESLVHAAADFVPRQRGIWPDFRPELSVVEQRVRDLVHFAEHWTDFAPDIRERLARLQIPRARSRTERRKFECGRAKEPSGEPHRVAHFRETRDIRGERHVTLRRGRDGLGIEGRAALHIHWIAKPLGQVTGRAVARWVSEQLSRDAVAPVFAPVPAIFATIAPILTPVAHILPAVEPVLDPIEPPAVVAGIAHIFTLVAPVLTAVAYILATIAAVLATIAHIFNAIARVSTTTRRLLRVSGRGHCDEGHESARIDQSTQHVPSSLVRGAPCAPLLRWTLRRDWC